MNSKKIIALFISISLVSPPIWSMPTPKAMPDGVSSQTIHGIAIPTEFVQLKQIHTGNLGKHIIYIEDAHTNFSGQKNLAYALNYWLSSNGPGTVFAEGASQNSNLADLRSKINPADMTIIANQLLRDGMIGGHEYLNLTTEAGMNIEGIEKPALYYANLKSYADLKNIRLITKSNLHQIRNSINMLKKRIFPKEALDFENEILQYNKSGELPNTAIKWGDRLKLHSLSLTALDEFKALQHEENKIDFNATNKEFRKLIQTLKQNNVIPKILNNRVDLNKSNPLQIYSEINSLLKILDKIGESTKSFPNLVLYIDYLYKFSKLDMNAILEETDQLINHAYNKLLVNETQRKLHHIDTYIGLLDKALNIKLSSNEFKKWKSMQYKLPTQSWQAYLNQLIIEHNLTENWIPYNSSVEDSLKLIETFYSIVNQRDEAFVQNINKHMNKSDISVAYLVSGGYHTDNLARLIKDKGYSLTIVTPIITHETDSEYYEKTLLSALDYKIEQMNNTHVDNDVRHTNTDNVLNDYTTLVPALISDPLSNPRLTEYAKRHVASPRMSYFLNTLNTWKSSRRSILAGAIGALSAFYVNSSNLDAQMQDNIAVITNIQELREYEHAASTIDQELHDIYTGLGRIEVFDTLGGRVNPSDLAEFRPLGTLTAAEKQIVQDNYAKSPALYTKWNKTRVLSDTTLVRPLNWKVHNINAIPSGPLFELVNLTPEGKTVYAKALEEGLYFKSKHNKIVLEVAAYQAIIDQLYKIKARQNQARNWASEVPTRHQTGDRTKNSDTLYQLNSWGVAISTSPPNSLTKGKFPEKIVRVTDATNKVGNKITIQEIQYVNRKLTSGDIDLLVSEVSKTLSAKSDIDLDSIVLSKGWVLGNRALDALRTHLNQIYKTQRQDHATSNPNDSWSHIYHEEALLEKIEVQVLTSRWEELKIRIEEFINRQAQTWYDENKGLITKLTDGQVEMLTTNYENAIRARKRTQVGAQLQDPEVGIDTWLDGQSGKRPVAIFTPLEGLSNDKERVVFYSWEEVVAHANGQDLNHTVTVADHTNFTDYANYPRGLPRATLPLVETLKQGLTLRTVDQNITNKLQATGTYSPAARYNQLVLPKDRGGKSHEEAYHRWLVLSPDQEIIWIARDFDLPPHYKIAAEIARKSKDGSAPLPGGLVIAQFLGAAELNDDNDVVYRINVDVTADEKAEVLEYLGKLYLKQRISKNRYYNMTKLTQENRANFVSRNFKHLSPQDKKAARELIGVPYVDNNTGALLVLSKQPYIDTIIDDKYTDNVHLWPLTNFTAPDNRVFLGFNTRFLKDVVTSMEEVIRLAGTTYFERNGGSPILDPFGDFKRRFETFQRILREGGSISQTHNDHWLQESSPVLGDKAYKAALAKFNSAVRKLVYMTEQNDLPNDVTKEDAYKLLERMLERLEAPYDITDELLHSPIRRPSTFAITGSNRALEQSLKDYSDLTGEPEYTLHRELTLKKLEIVYNNHVASKQSSDASRLTSVPSISLQPKAKDAKLVSWPSVQYSHSSTNNPYQISYNTRLFLSQISSHSSNQGKSIALVVNGNSNAAIATNDASGAIRADASTQTSRWRWADNGHTIDLDDDESLESDRLHNQRTTPSPNRTIKDEISRVLSIKDALSSADLGIIFKPINYQINLKELLSVYEESKRLDIAKKLQFIFDHISAQGLGSVQFEEDIFGLVSQQPIKEASTLNFWSLATELVPENKLHLPYLSNNEKGVLPILSMFHAGHIIANLITYKNQHGGQLDPLALEQLGSFIRHLAQSDLVFNQMALNHLEFGDASVQYNDYAIKPISLFSDVEAFIYYQQLSRMSSAFSA